MKIKDFQLSKFKLNKTKVLIKSKNPCDSPTPKSVGLFGFLGYQENLVCFSRFSGSRKFKNKKNFLDRKRNGGQELQLKSRSFFFI